MRIVTKRFELWSDDDVEDALRSTYASANVPESVRCRTMAAVLATRRENRRSHRRWSDGRSMVLRVGALATIVLLLVVAIEVIDIRRTEDNGSVVQAAERLLAQPSAGRGRHIVTSVYQHSSRVGGERAWVTEIWERTANDGTWERTVEAREVDGAPIGRLVLTSISWSMSYRGGVETGDGEPAWVPDELRVTSVSLDQVRSSLSGADSSRIHTTEVDGHQVIEIDLGADFDPVALAAVASTLDRKVTGVFWKIELAEGDERLSRASLLAQSAQGDEYVLTSSTVQIWDDVAGDQLADAAFAMPTQPPPASCSQRTFRGSLPVGLRSSEQYCEDGSIDHVILGNGAGLTVEVTISPKSNRMIEPPREHVQYVDTSVGEVAWVGHPDNTNPIGAVWSDAQSWYSVTVLSEPRWTLDDLVSLVEAVTTAP